MAETSSTPATARDWRWIALIGCACFPASFALFHYALPVGAWVASTPELVASVFLAALASLLAMLLVAGFVTRGLQVHNLRMRVALNNMSQGLCMFDRNERLVVCNRRYMEMYKLPADVAKPGRTLASLLEYRIANGTFSRDPDQYRRELLASMAQGNTTTTEVKSADGRTIFVINRPMTGGGWVATHEDITERRDAERERASMQEQQQRRAMIEQAIAAFRQRVEDHLAHGDRGRHGHALHRHHAVRQFRADLEERRERGGGLERSLRQCGDRRDRRRRTGRLDRRNRPPAGHDHRHRARGGQRGARHQPADRRAGASRAEDRRRDQADPRHRRADQPAGAQRHHRGRARRRSRQGLRGGGVGSQIAGGADRQGDRGHFAA